MHFIQQIKKEILDLLPAIIYFALAFNFIYFVTGFVVPPDEVRHLTYLEVNLCALLMGKMLFIINQFPFLNAFSKKPLIYNIIWKFAVYGFFIFLFSMMEMILESMLKQDNFSIALSLVKIEVLSPLFFATQLSLMAVFLIYIIASEFVRILGADRVKKILFDS